MSAVSAPVQHEPATTRSRRTGPKRSVWIRPGWWRALLWTWAAGGIGIALPAIIRWLLGWDWYSRPVTFTTVLFLMPIGFILGIGCFDYWGRYIIGSPTRPEDHDDHGAYRWQDYFKVNTDHKVIGIQYLVTTFAFFLIGGLCAEAFRTELAKPGLQFMTGEQYNGLISVHAALMIFLFIIPAFAGLANFVIPLMLGADDMAFPRLNALSFWMLPTAGVMMVASLFWQGFGAGWTAYAPLASDYQTVSQLFFNIGVQFAGTSSILTAVNFIVTILTMRAPGMTLWRMPLLVWANLTTSALVVLGTPFVAASQFMLLFDHVMHTDFFNYQGGGAVLLYQHVFWFYSHPAVYIMMLPGFGIVSEVISVMARKPIFGYRAVAFSTISIGVLGFTVWAHHMFVAGHAAVAAHPDHDLDAPDRGADRHQGVLVGRHALERRDRPERRRCCSCSASCSRSCSAASRASGSRSSRSTSTSRARTSSSRTSTTCCSAGRCSRSTPGCTSGTRR